MNKVISLNFHREKKKLNLDAYHAKILCADKQELMHEMVAFQEERSRRGKLNLEMIERGLILFKALEETANTEALETLSRSYRRHLMEEKKQLSGVL